MRLTVMRTHKRPIRQRFALLMALLSITALSATYSRASSTQLPDGLSLIGLSNGQWQIYVIHRGEFEIIPGIDSPRTSAYHHKTQQIAYIGAKGELQLRDLKAESTIELGGADANSRYTQPHFSKDGRWLYVVELPEGKSRRTNILGFDIESGEVHGVVRKRTAQFEPSVSASGVLYYTTAICVDDCVGMIWELWRKDMLSGVQEQLTLMNAMATHPHISEDGWLYFTSNAKGARHNIWRIRPEVGAKPQQISKSNALESEPVTANNGTLYFLRRGSNRTELVQWIDGEEFVVDTSQFEDIRNLGIE